MNAVSPSHAPGPSLTSADIALAASGTAHPLFQQAIMAALSSRFPTDVLLQTADAAAELLPYLPSTAPDGELPPAFRLQMLVEALRLAAPRFDAPVPRIPAPAEVALPHGCQAIALLNAARAVEAQLAAMLGGTDAREVVACLGRLTHSGATWRVLQPAEVAIALSNAGLGWQQAEALLGAITLSPLVQQLRIGAVMRLLTDTRECLR